MANNIKGVEIEEIQRDGDDPELTAAALEEKLRLDEEEKQRIEDKSPEYDEEDDESKQETIDFNDLIDEEEIKELETELSEEEKARNYEESKVLKNEGNILFKNGDYMKSIEIYTKALRKCPITYPKDRSILYSNRAACKISLQSKKAAIDDCSKAIELNSEYIRALLRRSKLYEDTEQYDESLEDYKRINELDPGNKEAIEALIRLPPLIEERNEKLKEDLLGKLKDLGDMVLRPFGLSTNNFQMQKDPSTGSYSINFNK